MTKPRGSLLDRPAIFLAAAFAVGLLCWAGVRQVRALTENPLRLDVFFHLLWVQEPPAVVVYFAVLLTAAVFARWMPTSWPTAVARFVGRRPMLIATVVAVALMAGSVTVYRSYPISMDEYAAATQAEIFASFRVSGSYPSTLFERLVPEFFLGYFFTPSGTGEFSSNYWPGHSLLMAPFAFFGAPWMLNPLLAGVALLLLAAAARKLGSSDDPEAALELSGWALLFAIASPEFLANGLSFYSMTAHLAVNLLFALVLRRPTYFRIWCAGVVGGFALTLHQPVPHALFALPWVVWMLASPLRWRRLLVFALGYVPFVLLLGVGWFAYRMELQSVPLPQQLVPTPYEETTVGAPELGDQVRGAGGLVDTVKRLVSSAVQVPTAFSLWTRALGYAKLALWTLPGLPVLALFGLLALSGRDEESERSDVAREEADPPMSPSTWLRLMAASAATTMLFYFFVSFSQGHGWGFRYFHSAWAALPLLASAALAAVPADRGWRRLMLGLVLLSLIAGASLRSTQIQSFIDRQRSQIPPTAQLEPGERLVQFLHPHVGFFRADLIRNDPFLRSAVIQFVSVDAESDAELMSLVFPTAVVEARYGEETVWRVPAVQRDGSGRSPAVLDPVPQVRPRGVPREEEP
ncbi:MAG: hypothetical protein AAGK22_19675 [Acidobacteriota bacterium]